MKVSQVIHGRVTTLELHRVDEDRFPAGLPINAEVMLLDEDRGEFRIGVGEEVWSVTGAKDRDADQLRQIASRNLPQLVWLVQVTPARGDAESILVRIHEFPMAFSWPDSIEIGVDDRLVEDMRKRRKRLISVESVVQWLTDKMLLHARSAGAQPRMLLSGSPMPAAGKKTAFRIYGNGFAVDVERGPDERLRATRVVGSRRAVEGDENRPIYLASGDIRFCDVTVAGEFRGVARTSLDALVAQSDSYLGLWREYNLRERASIVHRARQFGWIGYTSKPRQLPDGSWAFKLNLDQGRADAFWQRLDALDDEQLQAGQEVPSVIQGADDDGTPARGPRKPFLGELVGRRESPPSVSLRPSPEHEDRTPPDKGFLFVSLGGDEVRIQRRTDAWERIRACANPMPQLGMMIEGQPVPERHGRKLDALKKSVRDAFPQINDQQLLALDRALNTPDIALVQGPPGTGKTRVIAALQARLAEPDEVSGSNGLAGNTLLTSFQHDAVENAAAATRVLGLPAVKIGRRRGEEEARDGVEIWASETAQKARAQRAAVGGGDSVHAALTSVRQVATSYLRSPAERDRPGDVLRRILDVSSEWLPSDLVAEMVRLRTELGGTGGAPLEDEDRVFAQKAVRALRVEAVPFGDDGPMNAHKALRRLERLDGFVVDPAERAALERAASWAPGAEPEPALLDALVAVRDALLDRLQPEDHSSRPRTHVDVERAIVRAVDSLSERARSMAPGADVAIAEWIADLESDPDGVRDAVQHYSMVLAATCQQAVSRAMADAKLGDDTVFRTVVVDEAARSNPLDLMIPMARAERRVVLVGDHRQLPHILEPDIERELEQSVREETKRALRQSLFERLFVDLRAREKSDGVKRTVTLNVQYRMHPMLGKFVSEQFYEPYGEGFGSGRLAEEFEHEVTLARGQKLAGKVAAWIDAPASQGGERGGRSKRRRAEAERIAAEVRHVVQRFPELSVGVITFYAAQRDEILERMADTELTEPDDSGAYRVRDAWKHTTDGRERLRIGTVDAFQGKEFDVVFLSMTRSNKDKVRDERSRRRKYGFLLLENRLCVAMSRQHRLLIVVGDPEMVRGAEAETSIPGLVAFRHLCEESHGTVVRS